MNVLPPATSKPFDHNAQQASETPGISGPNLIVPEVQPDWVKTVERLTKSISKETSFYMGGETGS